MKNQYRCKFSWKTRWTTAIKAFKVIQIVNVVTNCFMMQCYSSAKNISAQQTSTSIGKGRLAVGILLWMCWRKLSTFARYSNTQSEWWWVINTCSCILHGYGNGIYLELGALRGLANVSEHNISNDYYRTMKSIKTCKSLAVLRYAQWAQRGINVRCYGSTNPLRRQPTMAASCIWVAYANNMLPYKLNCTEL